MTCFFYIRITIYIATIFTSIFCISFFCTSWFNNLFTIIMTYSLDFLTSNNLITSCTVHYLFAIIFTSSFLLSNPLVSRVMNNYLKTCSMLFVWYYNFIYFIFITKTTYNIISNFFWCLIIIISCNNHTCSI